MEHKYIIRGMTCEHCRSSVEKALNDIKGVQAKVTLDPPVATIEMDKHIPIEMLQESLSEKGDYAIEMDNSSMSKQSHTVHDHKTMEHGMEHPTEHGVEHPTEHGVEHADHSGHEGHGSGGHMAHMGNLKQKFWISLFITIPIILLSSMMGLKLPFQFSFPGSDWVVMILASFLFFYGGMPFLQGAKMELKEKNPAMMTLISMGITVAYIYSLHASVSNHFFYFSGHRMDFFWKLATLIVIMLLGHWVEMKAVGNAGNALQKMAELLPGSTHLVGSDGNITDVPLTDS